MSSVFVITFDHVLFVALVIVASVCFGIMRIQDAMRRRRIARRKS